MRLLLSSTSQTHLHTMRTGNVLKEAVCALCSRNCRQRIRLSCTMCGIELIGKEVLDVALMQGIVGA